MNKWFIGIIFILCLSSFNQPDEEEYFSSAYNQDWSIQADSLSNSNTNYNVSKSIIADDIDKIPTSIQGNKTFIFFMFILLFLIIVFVKITSPDIIEDLFLSVRKRKYLINRFSRSKPTLHFNNFLLDVLFLIIISLFIFELQINVLRMSFIQILLFTTTFFIFKILLIYLIYRIFFKNQTFNVHLINILIFNRTSAIILTPIIFITTFMNESYSAIALNYLFYFAILLIGFRILRILMQLKLVYNYNLFYIILYLCIFEFSLYLILFRGIFEYI